MYGVELAGKELARALLARKEDRRPVTLVGYSLGARMIFVCLRELVKLRDRERPSDGHKVSDESKAGEEKTPLRSSKRPSMMDYFFSPPPPPPPTATRTEPVFSDTTTSTPQTPTKSIRSSAWHSVSGTPSSPLHPVESADDDDEYSTVPPTSPRDKHLTDGHATDDDDEEKIYADSVFKDSDHTHHTNLSRDNSSHSYNTTPSLTTPSVTDTLHHDDKLTSEDSSEDPNDILLSYPDDEMRQHIDRIIQDVILLGSPISSTSRWWSEVRSIINGRFINGYSKSDMMLGMYVYRYSIYVVYIIVYTSIYNSICICCMKV